MQVRAGVSLASPKLAVKGDSIDIRHSQTDTQTVFNYNTLPPLWRRRRLYASN